MEPQNPAVSTLPKATVLLTGSIQYFRKNFALLASILLIPLVFKVIQIFDFNSGITALASLFGAISGYLATIAVLVVITEKSETEFTVTSAYSASKKYILPTFLISFLATLAGFGGMVLFIIPGIIIGLLLSLAPYVFFVEGHRGMLALVQSWHYTRGSLVQILKKFVFLGLVVIIPILFFTIISLPFGHTVKDAAGKTHVVLPLLSQIVIQIFTLIFVSPISILYTFNIYKKLAAHKGPVTPEQAKSIKKKIIIFTVLGALFLLGIAIMIIAVAVGLVSGTIQVAPVYRTASALSAFNPLFNFFR